MVPIPRAAHPSRYCLAAAQEHISDIHKCSDCGLSPFRPSVTVPENVTVLNEDVFFGCDSLKEVKITGKVTKISDMSFANCNQLESVVIPASVTEIGESVFTGETTLNVYFGGTEADWNKITIGNDNKALETANIHYESDGE